MTVKKIAEAEFTRDMVDTMAQHFDFYAQEGVLRVEITDAGIWLPHPHVPTRQFLGLARLPRWMRN
ncbi:hypothetical protein [uncultured Paracoccus sp.]|uniref:hypothetical protein n=1 Tax=uncultured Paracoccus sp. TaxID=189685 RepID=UPI0026219021|nr:hypothetical protein [uncultured Paracoccus sp.]